MNIPKYIELFRNEITRKGFRPATIKNYVSCIECFLHYFEGKAGIENKRIYAHLMRHTSFTHMVENGTDINLIQKLAGHSSVKTTLLYTHISHNLIKNIQSPISNISL